MSATTAPVERPPDPNVNYTYPLEAGGLSEQELAEVRGLMRAVSAMDIHVTQWPCEEDARPRDVQMRAAARLVIFGALEAPSVKEAVELAQTVGREVLIVARDGGDISAAKKGARKFQPRAQLMIYNPREAGKAAEGIAAFARGDRPYMPLGNRKAMLPYLYSASALRKLRKAGALRALI